MRSVQLRTFGLFALLWITNPAQSVAGAQTLFGSYCQYRPAILVLLVDVTTRYDDFDREQLVGMLDKLLARLRFGERLVVRTIEDGFERSRELFDACLPGCPSGWDPLSSCKPVLARSQALQFKRLLLRAVGEVYRDPTERARSDILNTLRFRMSLIKGYAEARIWFFSDMLENVSFRLSADKRPVKALIASLRNDNLMVDLKTAKVSIYGMARGDHSTRPRLAKREYEKVLEFWKTYFSANGATLEHVQE